MSIKYDRVSVSPGVNVASRINQELQKIQEALERALDRLGESPNAMKSDLDMGLNDIINVKTLNTQELLIKGEDLLRAIDRAEQEEIDDILANISNIQSQLDSLGTAAYADTSTLLNRENHTGTQPISTISGLQAALNQLQDDIDAISEGGSSGSSWGEIDGDIDDQIDLRNKLREASDKSLEVVQENAQTVELRGEHRNKLVRLGMSVQEISLDPYLFSEAGQWVKVLIPWSVDIDLRSWSYYGFNSVDAIHLPEETIATIYCVGPGTVFITDTYVEGAELPAITFDFELEHLVDPELGEADVILWELGDGNPPEFGSATGDLSNIHSIQIVSETDTESYYNLRGEVGMYIDFMPPDMSEDDPPGTFITIHDYYIGPPMDINGFDVAIYSSEKVGRVLDTRDNELKWVYFFNISSIDPLVIDGSGTNTFNIYSW